MWMGGRLGVVVVVVVMSVAPHRREDVHAEVGLVAHHPDGHVAHVATVEELVAKHCNGNEMICGYIITTTTTTTKLTYL